LVCEHEKAPRRSIIGAVEREHATPAVARGEPVSRILDGVRPEYLRETLEHERRVREVCRGVDDQR
jgi:hypothetical protein